MKIALLDLRARLTEMPLPIPFRFTRKRGRDFEVRHRLDLTAMAPAIWSADEEDYDEVMSLVENLITMAIATSAERGVHLIAIDFRGWPTDVDSRNSMREIIDFVNTQANGLPVYRLERGERLEVLALSTNSNWITSEVVIQEGRKFGPVRGFVLTQPGDDLGHFASRVHVLEDGGVQYVPTASRGLPEGGWCLAYSIPPSGSLLAA